MILGMSTAAFTLLHVIISLVAIGSGLIVAWGMATSKRLPGLTALFLITTVATSATGFLFHSKAIGPPHIIGAISLAILALALIGLYVNKLVGAWRWIYIVSALFALYLNCFVGVIQAFQKLDFLRPLAPTQSEPPFVVSQLVVLALFVWLSLRSLQRFRFPASLAAI